MKSPMAVFLMLLVASGIASAQSPDELARIYRAYIAAVKRGNFASITALNSARVRKEISTEYNSPGDRRNLLPAGAACETRPSLAQSVRRNCALRRLIWCRVRTVSI